MSPAAIASKVSGDREVLANATAIVSGLSSLGDRTYIRRSGTEGLSKSAELYLTIHPHFGAHQWAMASHSWQTNEGSDFVSPPRPPALPALSRAAKQDRPRAYA